MNVWYAAYGSNLSSRRFRFYIDGGEPSGAARPYPGCRDPRPPKASRAWELPGELVFAKDSQTWDGGVAFVDLDNDEPRVYMRLYLLTHGQFEDVVAQENRLEPGSLSLDVTGVGGMHDLGTGFYPLVVGLASVDGIPVVSITDRTTDYSKPSVRYLRHVVRGLRETHATSDEEVVEYLLARPGVRGAYARDELAAAVEGTK